MKFRNQNNAPGNAAGFTLIELLIVVAIIAILAAIAVPNFLEAQTRAKTSRVVNDLRIISYGMDLYKVDHAKYPPSPWPQSGYFTSIGLAHPTNRKSHLFRELTTPISYIATLPRTPFKGKNWISVGAPGSPTSPSGYYQGHQREKDPGYVVRQWLHTSVRSLVPNWESKLYWLADVGPNLQWDNTPRGDGSLQVMYDATNGTLSKGNIYRWGPQ